MPTEHKLHVAITGLKAPIERALVAHLEAQPLVEFRLHEPDADMRELSATEVWVTGYIAGGKVTGAQIAQLPHLRGIIVSGMGFEYIDAAAATDRGIPIVNAPEFAVSVAEAALTLMLLITKNYPAMQRAIHAAQWPAPGADRGRTLAGKTLGIVGLGRIGGQMARYGAALSMRIIAADPGLSPEQAQARGAEELLPLPTLMARSDVICVCAPLNDSTRHLIDAQALAAAKPGAYLVNVARGALVDEPALIDALKTGQLAGAALDVLETEPPLPSNPLLSMSNVILTPHSLGATVENADLIAGSVYRSIECFLRGERPPNTVNL